MLAADQIQDRWHRWMRRAAVSQSSGTEAQARVAP